MKLTSALIAIFILFSFFIAPATHLYAAGNSADQACETLKAISPDKSCESKDETESSAKKIIKFVITVISFLAGVIAVVMIIVSGFKFVTSNGDSNSLSSSKKSLIYAIIGLLVVAMAQIIVKFVIKNAT